MESENESYSQEPSKKFPKVAIIGAGPSGLMSARHIKEVAEITVFESKSDLGGLWLYSDISERNHPNIESDEYYKLYGYLHDSIYYDLICNLPQQFMMFKDFPHDEKNTQYLLSRGAFQKYLNDYSDHFDIRNWIKFNTTVTNLKVNEESENRYKLSYVSYNNPDEDPIHHNESYDYVIIANGHFSTPNEPVFEGKETFTGSQFHIHNFRKFDDKDFKGKNVLLVGARYSATDLINHMFFYGTKDRINPNQVFITSRDASTLSKSEMYSELISEGSLKVKSGNIVKIDQDTVHFGDGSEEKIDTILYATGYYYSMPFIDPKDGIIEWDNLSESKLIEESEIESDCRKGLYFGPLYK